MVPVDMMVIVGQVKYMRGFVNVFVRFCRGLGGCGSVLLFFEFRIGNIELFLDIFDNWDVLLIVKYKEELK